VRVGRSLCASERDKTRLPIRALAALTIVAAGAVVAAAAPVAAKGPESVTLTGPGIDGTVDARRTADQNVPDQVHLDVC